MAISLPVQLTECKNQLWGSVTTAAASLEKLGETINDSSPHNLTSFNGVSASFSCTGSLSFSGIGDSKYLGITGNCAWSFESPSTYYFFISSVIASANISSGVYGGNGNIIVQRTTNTGSGTESITITYSNGSGGESTTSVSLSFS